MTHLPSLKPGRYAKPSLSALHRILTEEQFLVTQSAATERPFASPLNACFDRGIYVDVVTGEPLFSSRDKFSCDCGWPAFTRPLSPDVIIEQEDHSHGMRRTEVRSRTGNSHLGHVFFGEPGIPGGVRYCINGAALRFIPEQQLAALGYADLQELL